MKEIALNAKKRETGKQVAKRLRREEMVPGVYYMNGAESVAISADPKSLRPIVYSSAKRLVNLTIEGETTPKPCVIKEVKFHPVTDKLIHFDLLGLNPESKLTIKVPVVLKGQSIGVRKGGKLQHSLHAVNITCLPKDLVDSIEVDITSLEMGKSIHVRELNLPNVEIGVPGDTMIVFVNAPRGAQGQDETPQKGKK